MATNNSNNQQYSNESDGFKLSGGSTKRQLTVTGADITMTGSGTNTYTMPSASGTLVSTTSVIDVIYPVGAIYVSTVSTSPATLFGVGTWSAYAPGQVLVGKASSGTFATAGATGGVETVTLTSAQSGLPAHTHQQSVANGVLGGSARSAQADNTGGNYGIDNYTQANTAADAASAHNNLQPYIVVYIWTRTA